MSPIRSSILLYSLALVLFALGGCGYGFVLQGGGNLGPVSIEPSINQTPLTGAGIHMDAHLESNLAAMGVSKHGPNLPKLTCTITRATGKEITTNSASSNRYRLNLTVQATITNTEGKTIWQGIYTDEGEFASGGQAEDALDEACEKIANRIAQSIMAIKMDYEGY
jgi:hypothetical protein